ncbi:hypothetical protein Afil01_55400 [Actinorhabdospora filicis]|uniref:SMI1/KNR4 family protein n=1 Tax=Actinorhabdospora filicis TaxID=1785913 RepID=A0A9W6SQY7_9ACTN|nr:SMI1/KNR4 family protein [Actinorhabdospora filicis]GLZ80733.1 hypothetical protein Afil01_55400 [Actinorhabdospora filicis]
MDREYPAALAALAQAEIDYAEGEGIDLGVHAEFVSAAETTDWLRLWTGDPGIDGDAFRVFGEDGTGGAAALWLAREGRPLTEQPVVFLGSEGEIGVVAANLSDLLWLLADGVGPCEVVATAYDEPAAQPALVAIAERYASTPRRGADEIVAAARAEFPHFKRDVDAMIRY